MNKKIILALVLVVIAGSIIYLESSKSKQKIGGGIEIIPLSEVATTGNEVSSSTNSILDDRSEIIGEKSKKYPRAVELAGIEGYINTDKIKLADLVGKKVILLDFWTYSCINCQRTIPYLNAWYEKYKDKGLVIVGVHSPEFEFEKKYENVLNAVNEYAIKHPVVLDSNMGTWNAYQNRYWPRKYLIDIDGFIVYDHIGEGGYDETEMLIKEALKERVAVLDVANGIDTALVAPKNVVTTDSSKVESPEIYFGALRNDTLGNGEKNTLGVQNLSLPEAKKDNTLYLEGSWNFEKEFVSNTKVPAKIYFKYDAKNVYMVASSKEGVKIKIFLDGKFLKEIEIKDNKLYSLVEGGDYGSHILEIEIEGAGLEAYTFTFG